MYFWFISWNNIELSICSCRHIIVAGRKENIWLFSCSSFSFLLVFPFWKKSYLINCPTSISGFSNPFWSRLSTSYHVGNITINYIFVWLIKIYDLTKYFNSSIYDKNSIFSYLHGPKITWSRACNEWLGRNVALSMEAFFLVKMRSSQDFQMWRCSGSKIDQFLFWQMGPLPLLH